MKVVTKLELGAEYHTHLPMRINKLIEDAKGVEKTPNNGIAKSNLQLSKDMLLDDIKQAILQAYSLGVEAGTAKHKAFIAKQQGTQINE